MHPAGTLVEPLVDEELPPGYGAISVQTLVAHHLQLGTEKEGRVGIDQQQGVARSRIRRRDRHAVRSTRFRWLAQRSAIDRLARQIFAVERLPIDFHSSGP